MSAPGGPEEVAAHIEDYFARLHTAIDGLPRDRLVALAETLLGAYRNEKQVFTIGNGGSSSTASHLAADLAKNTTGPNMRRFRITSLNDNAAIVTALANDLGYEHVFSEQLVNLIRAGDVLIAVSASGNSPNIVNAIRYAQQQSAHVAALLGFDGGVAATLADNAIIVPSNDFGIVEDLHLAINHILVEHFRAYLTQAPAWVT
jgi:D-sedoheptulose 7-phosphate isomerase